MKLIFMQSSPASYHYSLGSNILSSQFSNTPNLCSIIEWG